jgi:predicted Zn-dependent protease
MQAIMKNTFVQGIVVLGCFFGLYYLLSRVDFMAIFEVEEKTNKTEKQLGDLFWKSIKNSETEVTNDSVDLLVDKLITRITKENSIDKKTLKVHIIEKDEINAFAMPNRYLVIYSGLIEDCTSESELAGVLCHELAHIEKNHVMKKLVKEVGLSVLISFTTGSNSPRMIKEMARMLSSSAYDRKLETEADLTGVDYMIKANLDPTKLADFLYKMSTESDLPEQIYWVSTHPEAKARAEAIIKYVKEEKFKNNPVLTKAEWEFLKEAIKK